MLLAAFLSRQRWMGHVDISSTTPNSGIVGISGGQAMVKAQSSAHIKVVFVGLYSCIFTTISVHNSGMSRRPRSRSRYPVQKAISHFSHLISHNAMPQELWSSDAAEPTTTTGPYVGHNIGPLLDHSTVPSADVASPNDNRLHLPQASTENHGWLPSVPTDGMLPPSSATTAGRPCQPPPYSASSTNYQASSSVYGLQHSNLQAASHNAQQVPHDDPSFIQGLEELRQIRGTLFVTANNPYSGIGPAEGFFVADDDQADFPQTPWLIKDSRYDPNAYLHSQTQQGTVRGDMANAGTYQGPIPSEGWQTPQQLHPLASTSMSYYPGANPTQRQAREVR
ncbi:hypothetical protein C8Q74DRAFT_1244726 [Fomes fomentarius]|nr:hypothetical protein C8Q74DRAFT_1244726 [Fomes fomentarius]